ncbi:MAG: riboflavin kinase [Bacteroidetes bacterium]|nr:riboflavin kinase [Bacteroidota bacterium]MCL2301835.1 riboflavin kinase [Lentimicrobiaceae bacterium]
MHEKIFGTVVHGLGRGKDFGFPTVNIKLNDSKLHIENGVYIVLITICRGAKFCTPTTFKGMLYVGTRPTLDLQETTIEIHILDFNEEVYNQQISFQILHKIRDEIRFGSVDELIGQLHQDRKMVYEYFEFKI